MTAADIVSYSERPFEPRCPDPAVCGSEWAAGHDIGSDPAVVMCSRCGRSGTIDLDDGTADSETPEPVFLAYTPGTLLGDEVEVTVRHVESVLGADGVFRPTGRLLVATYRKVITSARIEMGDA